MASRPTDRHGGWVITQATLTDGRCVSIGSDGHWMVEVKSPNNPTDTAEVLLALVDHMEQRQ